MVFVHAWCRCEDKMHGKGKYTYADGSVYDGQWQNSKMHGKGTYIYPNHDTYEGEFVEDQKQVSGTTCMHASARRASSRLVAEIGRQGA